jgi:tetratricopeptide (TPR) repeat protein
LPKPKIFPVILSARRRAIKRADEARDQLQPVRAAALYQVVIERWGPHFGILVQLGNARKDSGAFTEAEQAYKAALKINPRDADCHLQYGHLMKLSGDLKRAQEFYAEANRLDPSLSGAIEELRAFESQGIPRPSSVVDKPASPNAPAVQSHRRTDGWDLDAPSRVVCERLFTELQWRRK